MSEASAPNEGGVVPPNDRKRREPEKRREADEAVYFRPGHVISGQFTVVRELGRGGMGVVYEADDAITRQRLALKVMLPSVLAKPDAIQRFISEVNTARSLRHEGVVGVFDVRRDDGFYFFTMELVKGWTLRRIMDHYGPLPLGKAVGLIHRLSRALEYSHQYTVHRDVSPENVMVLKDATVRLLDFGIAKAIDLSEIPSAELPIGKTFYMAPEQRSNPGAVDGRADIFSMGVVLFEMLAGTLPTGYNRLTHIRDDVPDELDAIIGKALAPVERRFATAREFRQAVEAVYKRVQGKGQLPPEADPARRETGVEAHARSAKQHSA